MRHSSLSNSDQSNHDYQATYSSPQSQGGYGLVSKWASGATGFIDHSLVPRELTVPLKCLFIEIYLTTDVTEAVRLLIVIETIRVSVF